MFPPVAPYGENVLAQAPAPTYRPPPTPAFLIDRIDRWFSVFTARDNRFRNASDVGGPGGGSLNSTVSAALFLHHMPA